MSGRGLGVPWHEGPGRGSPAQACFEASRPASGSGVWDEACVNPGAVLG